jgi:hypothetical protein
MTMQVQRGLSWLVVILAFGFVLPLKAAAQIQYEKYCRALSEPGHYPDYERLPKYSIDRREYDISKPPVLALRISVSRKELQRGSMARLGCKLASSFRGETKIYALIFDDKESARRFESGFVEEITSKPVDDKYLWHLRARFTWNATTKEGAIAYIVPEFKDGLLTLTRVDIRLSGQE